MTKKSIMLWIILIALLIAIPVKFYVQKNSLKTYYCYNEIEKINSSLDRKECILYKIITKDPGEVNVGNSTCSKTFVNICQPDNETIFFLAEYKLKLFCDNCSTEGNVSGMWYINYYIDSDQQFLNRIGYEYKFKESSFNETYILNKFLDGGKE